MDLPKMLTIYIMPLPFPQPDAVQCRNIVLHGTEATGKSSITEHLLARLSESIETASRTQPQYEGSTFQYVTVNAAQCITSRHLFERIVGSVARLLEQEGGGSGLGSSDAVSVSRARTQRRCETLAQLSVALDTMLNKVAATDPRWRFVLVLDAIDRQREAPPTLLPGLARLSEMVCVFRS